MEIVIPYTPHDNQLILHNDNSRFKTIVCGRRFGKTTYAANKLIKESLLNPNNYGYVAPTKDQAKNIIWEILKDTFPEKLILKKNESELSIKNITGGEIKLFSADEPDRFRGLKFKGLILDEFADFKKGREFWDAVLRPTLIDLQGWCDFLGTPKGKLNVFYEMFIKDKNFYDEAYLGIDGEPIMIDDDFKSFRFKTEDNPYIPKEEIEKAKKTSAPQYFRQEYEASFENYTGIIYKELDTSKHIIKRDSLDIKDWWNIYIGIDTGRYTAISFIAIDDKGTAYLFDEIYDFDSIVSDIAKQIKYKLSINNIDISKVSFIIDSASQVKNEYKHNGINCYDAKKDIENQIAIVRNAFSKNILFFCDNCKKHIVEHQGYVWDDSSIKIKPKDENDHSCNSLQYVFSTYSLISSVDLKAKKQYENSLEYIASIPDYDNQAGLY